MAGRRAGKRANKAVTVLALIAVLGGMTTLVAYAVPLYRLFCEVTGFGGTTQRAAAGAGATETVERVVTVRFNADIDPALPWSFRPVQREVEVRVGEPQLVYYRAESRADAPVTGTATFNVTPAKAGQYFVKTECFCFTEQTLAAGEGVDMPVQFYIDPRIAGDRNAGDVTTITLSYTFFRAQTPDGEGAPERTTLSRTDARPAVN